MAASLGWSGDQATSSPCSRPAARISRRIPIRRGSSPDPAPTGSSPTAWRSNAAARLRNTALLGHADAVGRQHPGQGMEQHPRQAQQLGQPASVLAAGPAIAHQQRLAQVMAALDGDAAHRFRHRLDGDLQGSLGHPLGRDSRCQRRHGGRQGSKAAPHGLAIGGLVSAGTKHRRQGRDRQAAQQHVGIGDRGRASAVISRRPRIGPG